MTKEHTCDGLKHQVSKPYGDIMTTIYMEEDGRWWATNEEYTSQILFCPFCGIRLEVPA